MTVVVETEQDEANPVVLAGRTNGIDHDQAMERDATRREHV